MSFSTYVLLPLLLLLITIVIVRDDLICLNVVKEVDGLTLLTPQGRIWANHCVRDDVLSSETPQGLHD